MASDQLREVFEGIESATVLKPGDRVLLTVGANWTMERVDRAHEILGERFPEVTFGFAGGVDAVIVIPAATDA